MATDIEQLVVQMSADMRKFEKALDRASGITQQRMSDIDRRTARTSKALSNFGVGAFRGLAGGAVAALAPILSVTAALNTAKAALEDFDGIAKSAKASGLDGETFQEFAYSAELGGVATDQFAKALETFNRNAGLAAIGKGELVEKLKQLNPELLKSILATTDQAERFKVAADAIDSAGNASEKAALAAALFGDSGTRMVEVLKGGSAALADTATKARALGLVIDNDLLARAETLNDEFATASRVMDLNFKQALIDLAPVLIATAQLAGAVARGIIGIVDSVKTLENRSSSALEERLAFLQAGGLGNGPGNRSEGADALAAAQEAAQIQALLRQRAINSLREQLSAPKPIVVEGAGIDVDFGSGGGGAANDDSFDRQLAQIRARTSALAPEYALLMVLQ